MEPYTVPGSQITPDMLQQTYDTIMDPNAGPLQPVPSLLVTPSLRHVAEQMLNGQANAVPTHSRSESEERYAERMRGNFNPLDIEWGQVAARARDAMAVQLFQAQEHLTDTNAWFLINPDPNSIVWNQRNDIGYAAP